MGLDAALAAMAVGKIFGGLASMISAGDEADAIKAEGELEAMELQEEADRLAKQRKGERARMKMAYLKAGVTLEFTPELILKEQKKEDKKQEESLRKRSDFVDILGTQRAEQKKNEGRAEFISGLFGGASSAAQMPIFS